MKTMSITDGKSGRTPPAGGWTAYCAAVLTIQGKPTSNLAAYPASEPKQEGQDASRRV